MLKAETREDIEAVKKIALEGNFCVVYEDGLAINGFITFDQMQQVVKHLWFAKCSGIINAILSVHFLSP